MHLPRPVRRFYDCERCFAQRWHEKPTQHRNCAPEMVYGSVVPRPLPKPDGATAKDHHAPTGMHALVELHRRGEDERGAKAYEMRRDDDELDPTPIWGCLTHLLLDSAVVRWVGEYVRYRAGDYPPHDQRTPYYDYVIGRLAAEEGAQRSAEDEALDLEHGSEA